MSNSKDIALGIGIFIAAAGGMLLPKGFGANPKTESSVFEILAGAGVFMKPGLVLIALGLLIAAVSRLMRDE